MTARAEEVASRRRVLVGLGAAVAVALIALIVGVTRDDGSNSDVRTAAGAATTETAPEAGTGGAPAAGQTTPTVGASVLGIQFTNSTTTTAAIPPGAHTVITGGPRQAPVGPAPAAASGSPASTALPCRNSTNPACGNFSWDPPPGDNRPIEWRLTYSPQNPKTGEKVTFQLHATDP